MDLANICLMCQTLSWNIGRTQIQILKRSLLMYDTEMVVIEKAATTIKPIYLSITHSK